MSERDIIDAVTRKGHRPSDGTHGGSIWDITRNCVMIVYKSKRPFDSTRGRIRGTNWHSATYRVKIPIEKKWHRDKWIGVGCGPVHMSDERSTEDHQQWRRTKKEVHIGPDQLTSWFGRDGRSVPANWTRRPVHSNQPPMKRTKRWRSEFKNRKLKVGHVTACQAPARPSRTC